MTPLLWILNNSLYQYKVSKRSNKTIKIQNSLQNHIIQFDISLVSKKNMQRIDSSLSLSQDFDEEYEEDRTISLSVMNLSGKSEDK